MELRFAEGAPAVLSGTNYEEYGYDANVTRTSLRKRDGSTITYQYDAVSWNTIKVVPERSGGNTCPRCLLWL